MTRTRIIVKSSFGYGLYLDELVEEWNKVETNHKLEPYGKGTYKAYDMPIPLVQDIIEYFNGENPNYDIIYNVYDPTYSPD